MSKAKDSARVGTWNLDGRWSGAHQVKLADGACDVWLLTEVPSRAELPGFTMHRSKELMADCRHWAAIAVRDGLPTRPSTEDPHPASVAVDVDGVTYCASVLPWRACGTGHPWRGRTVAAKTEAATSALVGGLPPGRTVWGGDWNHAFNGREYAGSLAGRQTILKAVAALDLTVVTADLPHRLNDLYSIDHVAVPSQATVKRTERLPMGAEGRTLSDHDAYFVDVVLPHR